MKRKLKRSSTELFHCADNRARMSGPNPNMSGDCSELRGDCTGLRGDYTGIWGNCTVFSGNLDECELTDDERKKGVWIGELA